MKWDSKIKVDFNLLMSGTWVLEKKGRQKIHRFEKELGKGKVVIYNALDVPAPLDSKILDYLMLKSQENDWSEKVSVDSLRKFAREVGLGVGKEKLDRIRKSLEILVNARVRFENCFINTGTLDYIDSGDYEAINIGILSDYAIEKVSKRGRPRKVTVWFNKNFLALCKHSLGYKLVPYTPIHGLRDTPYALYKWAYRWYDAKKGCGERWIGDGKSLVKWYKNELNSTADYSYPSEILRRVNSAVKQLNDEKSKVPFSIKLKEENGKYKIVMQAKGCVIKTKQSPYDSLPESDRNDLLNYVKNNRKGIKNPYGFLKSLSNKELDIFMRRVKGKKVLVNADSKEPEGQANNKHLRDKVAEVVRSFGLSDEALILDDNGMGYNLYLCGLTGKKIHELNTNSDFMDVLTKLTGKPVKIV